MVDRMDIFIINSVLCFAKYLTQILNIALLIKENHRLTKFHHPSKKFVKKICKWEYLMKYTLLCLF